MSESLKFDKNDLRRIKVSTSITLIGIGLTLLEIEVIPFLMGLNYGKWNTLTQLFLILLNREGINILRKIFLDTNFTKKDEEKFI
jgi:hypothetical protein